MDPNSADVDGGKTTLTTPVIDLSGHASAALRYWRWYTNDTGGNVDDSWVVDVSPDSGVTWVNLETETVSERAWARKEVDLLSEIALTDRVVVRFIVSDYGDDSTVEAAIDDIEVVGSPNLQRHRILSRSLSDGLFTSPLLILSATADLSFSFIINTLNAVEATCRDLNISTRST